MCGIAGAWDVDGGVDVAVVERQVRLLDHRGPDSWGLHRGATAVVGQTRLAVVDLVTGDPPITDEAGTLGVAFNGEVYNYARLREELRAEGHTFRTTGDTEVVAVLASIEEPAALARRLDGMFAFAVADDRRGRLVLGRDPLGKKPLHYWTDGRRLVFGSELKSVLASPWVPRRLDESAIPAYLAFGYVPSPRTFYEGVVSLPPGHVLVADGDGVRTERYWDVPRRPAGGHDRVDDAEAEARIRAALRDAVAKRMVADVPVGAFLSGGLDSSSVVAMMTELSDRPVRTFTIGFEESRFDERQPAGAVARHLGTEHTEFVVRPDAVALMERLVEHHDQPFGDSSALPTWLLSELTRQHVTVALTGDGGDEVLAGYQRMAWGAALCRVPAAVGRPVSRLAPRLPARLGKLAGALGVPPHHAFREWITYVPAAERTALVGSASSWATDDYDAQWARSAGSHPLDRFQDLTIRTYLLDDLLPKADRMSMAHALEVRSPLLDPGLLATALALPPGQRLRRRRGKDVLRRAMADRLPPEPLERAKWGFGLPLDEWFRTSLRPFTDELLLAPTSRTRAHVDGDALTALVQRQRAGATLGHAVWTLATLELFLRREGW